MAKKRDQDAELLLPFLPPPNPTDTEMEACKFILDQLQQHDWNIRNPSRNAAGQVWTQNQCLAHPAIKLALGATRPENIVKLSETRIWIIEAKRDRAALDRAVEEAANDYAEPILRGGILDVPFISGVAGNNDTGYLVHTQMRVKGIWQTVTINSQPATALLTPSQIDTLIRQGTAAIKDYIPPSALFLHTAERINEILHYGSINKNE
jgi:type I restriction enzyme M protein